MNGLARAYKGDVRQQVQYVDHLNRITPEWDDKWGVSIGLSDSEAPTYYEIPHNVCEMLQALIEDHRKGRVRSEESNEIFFSTFLRYEDRNNIPRNFLRDWKDAKRWFQEYAHVGKDTFSVKVETGIVRYFRFLESMLYVAANSQYEQIRGIDAILDETNR